MNAYTTRGQARIQPRDFSAFLLSNQVAGAYLAGLERQRGWQAEAELDWLLRQNTAAPPARVAHVALLRQMVGAALVRAGERLAGVPRSGVSPEPAAPSGTLGLAR